MCYLSVREFLICFKYYHIVDWWRWFDQQDITKAPRGKVELWLCNEVQGSIKTMVKWCTENLLKDTKVGKTLEEQVILRLSAKLDRVDSRCWSKLVQAEQKICWCWVKENYSVCQVT